MIFLILTYSQELGGSSREDSDSRGSCDLIVIVQFYLDKHLWG